MIRKLFLILIVAPLALFSQTQTFHDFSANTILGAPLDFSVFYGKKVMVVNTATYCSYTYQYEALENLYNQYKDSNFVIVGFPCNDFGAQEPHPDSTINEFCIDEYGIDFQMMSKVSVIASDTVDIYKWLQRAHRNGVANASVTWNFHKFLIDEVGHWVAHYSQLKEPNDPAIIAWIESPSVIPPDTTATGFSHPLQAGFHISGITSEVIRFSIDNSNHQKASVKLYSATGQLQSSVYHGTPQDAEIIHADISFLNNGIYFLVMKNEKESRAFRFAVVR